jgi:hypothetical protein
MKNVLWLAILAGVLLAGCEKPEVVRSEYHDFKIDEVRARTPVHVWVYLTEIETGETYRVNTGKSCKAHQLLHVGSVVRLHQETYAYRSDANTKNAWSAENWPDRSKLCNL